MTTLHLKRCGTQCHLSILNQSLYPRFGQYWDAALRLTKVCCNLTMDSSKCVIWSSFVKYGLERTPVSSASFTSCNLTFSLSSTFAAGQNITSHFLLWDWLLFYCLNQVLAFLVCWQGSCFLTFSFFFLFNTCICPEWCHNLRMKKINFW